MKLFIVVLFSYLAVVLGQGATSEISFTCSNGKIVPIDRFCDGSDDCDGSDELYTSSSSSTNDNTKTSCSINGLTCLIDYEYVCNRSVTCQGTDPCTEGCPDYYRCRDKQCMPRSTICDGNSCNGCHEDDEWESGAGFQCVRNGKRCRIPQQLLYDGIQDCDQGEDLCYLPLNTTTRQALSNDVRSTLMSSLDRSRCFECLDRSMVIPRDKVCDHVIDCSDLSDECLCEGEIPSICFNVISRSSVLTTPGYEAFCDVGQVSCGNGSCIERSSVCDSTSDCPNNEDEKFEYCEGTLLCRNGKLDNQGERCRCQNYPCKTTIGILCNGIGDCPPPLATSRWSYKPGYPADECLAQCGNTSTFKCTNPSYFGVGVGIGFARCDVKVYPPQGSNDSNPVITTQNVNSNKFCDGVPDCNVNLEDESRSFCKERFFCQAGFSVNIPKSQVCDGIINCDDGSDESNSTCPDRFFCRALNGAKVSINKQEVCDEIINCDNKEDEMNCSDGRFYCENAVPLFVRNQKVFDGRSDCTDHSDECPIHSANRKENIFSSRYELIANPLLRALVWVMGVLALVGNSIIIVSEIKTFVEMRGKESSVPLRTNHSLILNLAVADLLMGVYLIMLGIAGGVYSGSFCAHDISWRSGITCQIMGVLVVVSSETSVITMLLLSMFRLFAVMKPFSASTKPSYQTLLILISFTWIFSLLLALIPFSTSLQYIFTDRAVIQHNPFFRNVVVDFDSAKNWAERLLTFEPELRNTTVDVVYRIRGATTWSGLKDLLGNIRLAELLEPSGYMRYYSVNSVCIPRLFVTHNDDKSWGFSLATIIFNFLSFVCVATIYGVILIKTRATDARLRGRLGSTSNRDVVISTMQRKIYRLVATDFCCWIPITIMVFINFSGTPVSDIAYVISAIVLLPINSALNPILYSNIIENMVGRVRNRRRLTSSSNSGAQETKLTNI